MEEEVKDKLSKSWPGLNDLLRLCNFELHWKMLSSFTSLDFVPFLFLSLQLLKMFIEIQIAIVI